MKKILVLFLLLPVGVFCQSEKPMKLKKNAPEVIFLKKVETAVKAHDADALMSFMEPGYKRTQHDEFLEGKTIQFLNEFFFCTDIKFMDIIDAVLIKYVQTKEDKNQYEVRFYLESAVANCYCTFYMQRHPETGVLSVFGAVG